VRRGTTAKTHSSGLAWWRTLFGLLNYPRLFAALAVGATLLTAAVSAYPLFLSSAGSDLVVSEIRRPLVTRYGVGIGYKSTNLDLNDHLPEGRATYEAIDVAFRRLTAESPDLGPPILGALGPNVAASSVHGIADARLMASTEALEHVRPVQGDPRSGGVWLPDLVAAEIEAKPGDTITLASQDGITVPAEVGGVYASLYSEPRRGYWHQWAGEIYPSRKFCVDPCPDPPVPPQFILMDLQTLRDVMGQLDNTTATVAWQAPLANGVEMTLDRAQRFEAFAERLRRRISADTTALGRLFDCCQERGVGIITIRETSFYSLMAGIVSRAEQRIAAIAAPGRVLQVTTVLVALAVLAAAGAFAVSARPTETRLRFARGASPTAFGVRAGIEAMVPCLVGTGVGFLLALLMMNFLGPGGPIDAGAITGTSLSALGAALSAILAIGLVATMSFLSKFEVRGGRTVWIGRIPWELLLLGLAWLTFSRLSSEGAFESAAGIDRPRPEVLLFPLLFIAGGAALAARGTRLLARILAGRWSKRPAGMLAIRRLARASGLAVALVAAAALSLGLLLHSQSVVRSLRETVDTRARIFVGSDLTAYVGDDTAVPEGFPLPATKVTRLGDAGTFTGTANEFDIFAIDPDTFAEAAFWRADFSSVPLEEIMERLQEPGDGMPVAIAGDAPSVIRSIERAGESTPVDVVARAEVFPGMLSHRPLVVVDVAALDRAFGGSSHPLNHPEATPKILIRGETREALDSLSLLSIVPYDTVTVDEMKDLPTTKALIESLVVLNALGLAAAALVVAGMLMYLQARQRGQLVAYGLTVRMGLTPPSYRRSIAVELGGMLAAALITGALTGIAAGYFVNRFVDPLGSIPPAPLFRLPVLPVLLLAIGLAVVALAGAWWTSRTAARAKFGEVMRVAET
jgi:putative ABC transport system permease protein